MKTKLSYIILTLQICTFFVFSSGDTSSDRLVAFGESSLTECDVRIELIQVKQDLKLKLGRIPTDSELTAEVEMQRFQYIWNWIYEKIQEEAINDMGLEISDTEKRKRLSAIYGDEAKLLHKTKTIIQQLPSAWRTAKANPANERQIYEDHLGGIMPYERWRQYFMRDDTEVLIRRLEKMEQPTKSDLYRVDPSFEKILLRQKLINRVTEKVFVTEDELRKEYKKMGYEKPFEVVKNTVEEIAIGVKRENAWQSWIKTQMARPDIVIYDQKVKKQFKSSLKKIKGI